MHHRSDAHLLRGALLCAGALLAAVPLAAQPAAITLAERARGAERIIVGRVAAITPRWQESEFGDRLIVSVLAVVVDETLKGGSQPSVTIEIEGGTIGTLTLRVSDLDTFAPGDRAVFYLTHDRRGALVPHRRGLGLQKLDAAGRVRGGQMTLEQIRREVRAGSERQP